MPKAVTMPSDLSGERFFERVSPLLAVTVPGSFGASRDEPGVTLSVRHPLSVVSITTRMGQAEALSSALQLHYGVDAPHPGHSAAGAGLTLHWCGAGQYYGQADGRGEGALYRELKSRLSGLASCTDQSHGRVTIAVRGPRARDLLAKGTSVDLHPGVFGQGRCAVTLMAHVGVHLAQVGSDSFEISVFRSFARGFWEWLTTQAEEMGYAIR